DPREPSGPWTWRGPFGDRSPRSTPPAARSNLHTHARDVNRTARGHPVEASRPRYEYAASVDPCLKLYPSSPSLVSPRSNRRAAEGGQMPGGIILRRWGSARTVHLSATVHSCIVIRTVRPDIRGLGETAMPYQFSLGSVETGASRTRLSAGVLVAV